MPHPRYLIRQRQRYLSAQGLPTSNRYEDLEWYMGVSNVSVIGLKVKLKEDSTLLTLDHSSIYTIKEIDQRSTLIKLRGHNRWYGAKHFVIVNEEFTGNQSGFRKFQRKITNAQY